MRTALSKSKYTKFCQCPKALWMGKNKPEEATIDASVEARFAEGNIVGDLAMGLFGGFVEVTTMNGDKLDLGAMIEKTRELLAGNECNVICEASFSYGNGEHCNYCAVDILRRTAGGWAIYEVKSSTSHIGDEITSPDKFVKYAIDIAYQKWVLEKCGVNVTGTYLVTLNSDYVREGEIDIQQLFNIIDLKELVANEYVKVANNTSLAHSVLGMENEPCKKIGIHCTTPYQCEFWKYCTKQAGLDLENDKATVFYLYRMNTKKKFEYFDAGKVTFKFSERFTSSLSSEFRSARR
jgi:hypothetical protein